MNPNDGCRVDGLLHLPPLTSKMRGSNFYPVFNVQPIQNHVPGLVRGHDDTTVLYPCTPCCSLRVMF